MEKIIIENFGGLKKMEFELKNINILIGPQASGKSMTVKLLYFFKTFTSEIIKSIENGESKRTLDSKQREKFSNYFPKESWPQGNFRIRYVSNETWISIERKSSKSLNFNYSENLVKMISRGRKFLKDEQKKVDLERRIGSFRANRNMRNRFNECLKNEFSEILSYNQFFIPAGRSFFANIQSSIFSFLSNNKSLDPFLIEFGSFYDSFKRFSLDEDSEEDKKNNKVFNKVINDIMSGSYKREKEKDFIVHNDTRKVNLASASSGQQEILPLILVLKVLSGINFINGGATLYIEEPEAHLFPTAQKKIVKLLARTFNSQNSNFQIIVTTHSPYILSSFNNLLEGGKIIEDDNKKSNKVYEVIPEKEILHPNDLIAYSIFNGKKQNLMDEETKLISQNILDSVSDEISMDFGKLLDIEF